MSETVESLRAIEEIFTREKDIAAFIAEPIRCTTVVRPPIEYWKRVRELCDQFGALLIFDEIPIGLGRIGRMFACEYAEVSPDIVCLGKGLGGGVFPMAAMLAPSGLNIAAANSIGHFTHEKSPVGAAAAIATLDVIEDERLLERAMTTGARFARELETLKARHPVIGEVRAFGMLFGVELRDDPRSGLAAAAAAEAMLYACLCSGLSFKISAGNVLTLAPPLNIVDAQLDRAAGILDAAFDELSPSS